MKLAERLKKTRELLGVSQQEMARRLGISKPAWQGYELGKNEPGSGVIEELVKLGFNANWLLTGEGLIRQVDRIETFKLPLLTIIVEALEEHEIDAGKQLSSDEKAYFISEAYEMFMDDDAAQNTTKEKILEGMKPVYDLLASVDSMIKTKRGRERAKKLLMKEIRTTFSRDEAEWEVEEFLGSRILKINSEKEVKGKNPE